MGAFLEGEAELESPLYRRAADWLGELAPAFGVRRVLDVGSGPGVLTTLLAEVFPHADVIAADPSAQLLERARARAGRAGLGDRFHALRAELPGGLDAMEPVDLIWAGNMVHHVGDQSAALGDLARRLRPGGVLAVLEGGLSARRLPRDIGMGRPGLEARLAAAETERFSRMRASLPGVRDEVEDWPSLLAGAGLTPSGSRSFLLDVPAPAPAEARAHHVEHLRRRRTGLEDLLDGDDLAVLDRLTDPEDPQGILRRTDTYLLNVRTVHTARR